RPARSHGLAALRVSGVGHVAAGRPTRGTALAATHDRRAHTGWPPCASRGRATWRPGGQPVAQPSPPPTTGALTRVGRLARLGGVPRGGRAANPWHSPRRHPRPARSHGLAALRVSGV